MVVRTSIAPKLKSCCAWLAFAASLMAAPGHAATITVGADSEYFKDWVFTRIARPDGGSARVYLQPGEKASGTLHNRNFEIYGEEWPAGTPCYGNSTGDPIPQMCFGYTPNWFMGMDLPVNIGGNFYYTNTISDINLRQGYATVAFKSPLPAGTTIFFQDVDNPESARIFFQNCSQANVDAANADILRISTVNTPQITLEGTAPDNYWQIQHNSNSDNFSVNGIVINRSDVCSIRIEGWRNNNVGGGSIRYFLGAPMAAFAAQNAANAAPVPTNAWWMLALSGLGIAALARKRQKTA